jgi:hypothetical protein
VARVAVAVVVGNLDKTVTAQNLAMVEMVLLPLLLERLLLAPVAVVVGLTATVRLKVLVAQVVVVTVARLQPARLER